jgi:hypothetical protein
MESVALFPFSEYWDLYWLHNFCFSLARSRLGFSSGAHEVVLKNL